MEPFHWNRNIPIPKQNIVLQATCASEKRDQFVFSMAKSKRKSGSKAKNQKANKDEKKEEINIDSLLEKAESLIISCTYEEAEQELHEILAVDENNIKALEMLANLFMENPDPSKAINIYKKCIDLAPDVGYHKYLNMGQLHEGEESIAFYEKGIQVIEKELNEFENNPSAEAKQQKVLIRDLSRAYCSISELYTTDCCDLENAEERCREAVENAIKTDLSNPEAYQSRANFLLIEGKDDEAKEDMKKCYSLWLPLLTARYDMNNEDEAAKDVEEMLGTITRDAMVQTSKLLIEVEMYDEAMEILQGLLDDDDQDIEVWYLLGIMHYHQGEEYKTTAHDFLENANKLIQKNGCPLEDVAMHVSELIEELKETHPLSDDEDDDALGARFDEAVDLETDSEEEMEV